jgi:hypothetical protein
MLLSQVKELEVKLKEDETTKTAAEDRKKKLGVKDTAEVNKLKKELKTKIEELDKFKTQAKKVSTIKMSYCSGSARTVHMAHNSQDMAILVMSLINELSSVSALSEADDYLIGKEFP